MATLQVQGKAKRAQTLADPAVQFYFVFSSATPTASDNVAIDPNSLMGAVKVQKKLLVTEDANASAGTAEVINGVNYKSFLGATLGTLTSNKVHKLYVEGLLNSGAISTTDKVVKSIYVVSYMQGLSPNGLSPVPHTLLTQNSVNYVVEAVEVLSAGNYITVDNSTNKLLGLIIEL